MKKDDIKTLIVIVIVCAICLILVLIFSREKNTDKLEAVKEYNTYFSVTNYMNSYISYLSNNDGEAVYSMLSKEYISKNNINQNNVFNIVDTYDPNSLLTLKITSIKQVKVTSSSYIYYIKGQLLKNTFDNTEIINNNYEVLLLADYKTLSESVYPIEGNNYEKIINSIKKVNIEKNEYNKIKSSSLTNSETICVLYLSDYVDKLNNDIEESYKLLNDNMKEKYATIDMFKAYLEVNKEKITTKAEKCAKEGNSYMVIDANNNNYTFYEESVMNYKVSFSFDEIED